MRLCNIKSWSQWTRKSWADKSVTDKFSVLNIFHSYIQKDTYDEGFRLTVGKKTRPLFLGHLWPFFKWALQEKLTMSDLNRGSQSLSLSEEKERQFSQRTRERWESKQNRAKDSILQQKRCTKGEGDNAKAI